MTISRIGAESRLGGRRGSFMVSKAFIFFHLFLFYFIFIIFFSLARGPAEKGGFLFFFVLVSFRCGLVTIDFLL